MDARFAAAIGAAAAGTPMSNGDVAVVPGRLLGVDGDGLCYYCAGNDDTSPGEARKRLVEKIAAAQRASGAESIKVVTTARGSHKGYRYAVARVKPYQGQREGSRRPKNWEYLREFLESYEGQAFHVEFTDIAEADDLFSRYALHHPDFVMMTQDKDMNMVPGWHLDWVTHIMLKVEPGAWHVPTGNSAKPMGRVWFWQQMLQGDSADNIPGLPFYTDGSIVGSGPNKGEVKQIRIGEPKADTVGTATKLLEGCASDMGALLTEQKLYRSCYGDRWLVEMLEQGILLWMRTDTQSSPLNVTAPGNPLHALTTHELWPAARAEILQRIAEAMVHEEAQGERNSDGEAATLAEEQHAVRALFPPVLDGASSARPLPLLGTGTRHPAPLVQCVAGQGGEQLQAVRSVQPVGLPAWLRGVLAKA